MMKIQWSTTFVFLPLFSPIASAFIIPSPSFFSKPLSLLRRPGAPFSNHQTSPPTLFSSKQDNIHNDDDDDEEEQQQQQIPINKIDFRMFLNQRCVQSFMFLLTQTRDPHTIKWLDTFTQPIIPKNPFEEQFKDLMDSTTSGGGTAFLNNDKMISSKLLQYHGLEGFNMTKFPTWDLYFQKLLEEPDDCLRIDANNPQIPYFEIDIQPASLCSRILSVREQLAKEWVKDLDVIGKMGREIFESYWENVKKEKDLQQQQQRRDGDESDSFAGFERQNLMFLDWDPNFDDDYAPSPLRKGNFDLLCLLLTREAIHRVLQQGRLFLEEEEDPKKRRQQGSASANFLYEFYIQRIPSHFYGSLRYGRADDFIEELMIEPPRIVNSGDDAAVLVNPLNIAEVVVTEREKVALEWKDLASEIPNEHMEIRKLQLSRMMGVMEDVEEEEGSFG